MNKPLLTFCLLLSCQAANAITPADLIDVGAHPDTKCVEYYEYQGTMHCSMQALSKDPVDPDIRDYEKQMLVFDQRPWQFAWGKKTDNMFMVEYVPMGGDINNWYELVTSQVFEGLPESVTPKDFAEQIIAGIKDSGFDPIIDYIKDTPQQVLFEYRINKPAEQKQDELQIITKQNGTFYIVHYVIKESDMGAERRKQWISNLENSKIK